MYLMLMWSIPSNTLDSDPKAKTIFQSMTQHLVEVSPGTSVTHGGGGGDYVTEQTDENPTDCHIPA